MMTIINYLSVFYAGNCVMFI